MRKMEPLTGFEPAYPKESLYESAAIDLYATAAFFLRLV